MITFRKITFLRSLPVVFAGKDVSDVCDIATSASKFYLTIAVICIVSVSDGQKEAKFITKIIGSR